MIYLEKNDIHSTLTTWLYCHFWMMWRYEQLGQDVYIHWPKGKSVKSYEDLQKFAEIPNMYDWYFIQPKIRFGESVTEVFTWEYWVDLSTRPFMSQPLSVIKDYYKKNLHFNEETEKRGQAIVEKYGIDFTKTIGLTWRGSDIYLESANGYAGRRYTPIETYFEWIDKALEEIPDARIACTAEEQDILTPLFKRYGERAFNIDEFISVPKGSKHNPERFSNVSGFERGLQPVLMVWLFSKCAWLIKNRASTSAVASWLSDDGQIVNINHTEVLGFPPHIDGVEFKGKLYL